MPVLFEQNGYDVTVCDPTYAGYQWIPDLSIYDDYPDIHTYITKGKFTDTRSKKELIEDNSRNFFCYALMKTMPLFLHSPLYNGGDYNHASVAEDGSTTAPARRLRVSIPPPGFTAPLWSRIMCFRISPKLRRSPRTAGIPSS